MEREQIIKSLECFHQRILNTKFAENITEIEIMAIVDAIALINELIEENKSKDETISKLIEGIQAGTVLKIGFDDVARLIYGETEYFIIGNPFIDLIKKAMLEENENGQREND